MGEVPPPVLFPENIRTGKPYLNVSLRIMY